MSELERLKPILQPSYAELNSQIQALREQLLRRYWQVLWGDSAFQQAWRELWEQLAQGVLHEPLQVVSDFCTRWKLPAPYCRALQQIALQLTAMNLAELPQEPIRERIARWQQGEIDPHLVQMELHVALPSEASPAWNPEQESAQAHTTRVRRAASAYRQQVAAVYREWGLNPQRFAHWRNPEYQQRIVLQVYLRAVKGWSWGQIALRVKEKRAAVRKSTLQAARILGIALE